MKKIVLFLVLSAQYLFSQVSINPPVIFIEPDTKSGHVTINNYGMEAKQVEVYFKFGYTVSDSSGKGVITYNDSLKLENFSLLPYIKVFPKKFVLDPNKEQTFRFLVKNTSQLNDGTYWCRAVVKVSPALTQTDTAATSINPQMVFITETNTIIIFEKGKVNTGLELVSTNTLVDSQNVNLKLLFNKKGNSPFWGTININIIDQGGNLIDNKSEVVPIYTDGLRTISFDKSKFKPGVHTAEIIINSDHPGIKDDYRIKINPIESKIKFTIQ